MTSLLNLSQAIHQPFYTSKKPPRTKKTKCHCQPIGMVFVFHVETYKAFPYCCLFFVQLEQKHTSSDCDGLTDWSVSNRKHVVQSVDSTLDKSTPRSCLEGNDVRPIYTRIPAHNQYRFLANSQGTSVHSARDPPANQSVRLPSFFVQ